MSCPEPMSYGHLLSQTFEGHTVSVLRVSFLTHGMQLLSAGSDGLLKLWTIKTNECVATYDAHDDRVCGPLTGPEKT